MRRAELRVHFSLDSEEVVEKFRILVRQCWRRGDQRLDRHAPGFGGVAAQNASPGFDVTRDRMERTIGQVSRAVPFHDSEGFTAQTLDQREREPRLADARFAGDMHNLSGADPRGAPPAKERVKLLLAADERIEAGAGARVEAALHRAFAEQTVDRHWGGKALKDDVTFLLILEHCPT